MLRFYEKMNLDKHEEKAINTKIQNNMLKAIIYTDMRNHPELKTD